MRWHEASEQGFPSPILLTCQLGLLNFSLEIKILWNNKPHLLNMGKKISEMSSSSFHRGPMEKP